MIKYAPAEEIRRLFQVKDRFQIDYDKGTFGCPAKTYLLNKLKVKNFFVGHCHIEFGARVKKGDGEEVNF